MDNTETPPPPPAPDFTTTHPNQAPHETPQEVADYIAGRK